MQESAVAFWPLGFALWPPRGCPGTFRECVGTVLGDFWRLSFLAFSFVLFAAPPNEILQLSSPTATFPKCWIICFFFEWERSSAFSVSRLSGLFYASDN